MRLTSKLIVSVVVLFAAALASAALTAWSVHQSERGLVRVDYAHKVYEAYLALSGDATRLLWQIEHEPGGLEAREPSGRPAIESALRANLNTIRKLISEEIELFGEEEIDELIVLARIERIIEDLLRESRDATASAARNEVRAHDRKFDEELERAVRLKTTEVIASEMDEVRETVEQTRSSARRFRMLAAAFAGLALLATLFAVNRLLRGFSEPVERLLASAAVIEQGNLTHRVEVSGPAEMRDLADAFNRLADQIAAREVALADVRSSLETAAGERAQGNSRRWTFLRPSIRRAGA